MIAPRPDLTEKAILEQLTVWGERLHEYDHDLTNCTLTRAEILKQLDSWLDEYELALAQA